MSSYDIAHRIRTPFRTSPLTGTDVKSHIDPGGDSFFMNDTDDFFEDDNDDFFIA